MTFSELVDSAGATTSACVAAATLARPSAGEDDPSHSRQGCEDLNVTLLLLPRFGLLDWDADGQRDEPLMSVTKLTVDETRAMRCALAASIAPAEVTPLWAVARGVHPSWAPAKKAILAVAASILTAIYHMLKDGTLYEDLGRNYFDRRSADQHTKRLVRRLADLGYTVELTPLAAA